MSTLLRGLLHGYHAATASLARLETRDIADGPTADELALETEWRTALEPTLLALYLHPFRNGYAELPRDTKRALTRWITEQYAEHPEATVPLLLLLGRYLRRAANLGGQAALDLLHVDGIFALSAVSLLDELDEHAAALSATTGARSLVATTANDLVATLWPLVEAEATPAALQAAAEATAVDRSAYRATLIAATEVSWAVATALVWTYRYNTVGTVRFTPREGACTICTPHSGETYGVNRIPASVAIPLHPLCRCIWMPDTSDWTPPDTIWTGGTLP